MALFGKPDQNQMQGGTPDLPPMPGAAPMQQQPAGMPQQGYGQQPMEQQGYAQQQMVPEDSGTEERIEEVAEAIIDEKWNELLKDINKMIEWKEKTESRLTIIEQNIQNLKASFESLHKGVLGKISEYDQNLQEVGTDIKAMEKVFQKILPSFTENVNKLARITGTVSAKKK